MEGYEEIRVYEGKVDREEFETATKKTVELSGQLMRQEEERDKMKKEIEELRETVEVLKNGLESVLKRYRGEKP